MLNDEYVYCECAENDVLLCGCGNSHHIRIPSANSLGPNIIHWRDDHWWLECAFRTLSNDYKEEMYPENIIQTCKIAYYDENSSVDMAAMIRHKDPQKSINWTNPLIILCGIAGDLGYKLVRREEE